MPALLLALLPHDATADGLPAPGPAAPPEVVSEGIRADIMLHPVDAFTAHTLPRGTLVYNQAVQTLPLPSWAWWGVTDWAMVEFDLLPLIGGLFVEPHLPVPSVDLRFRLTKPRARRPSLAYETMVQYQWGPFDDQLGAESTVHVVRDGASWFHRVNMSQPLGAMAYLHLSLGGTWAQSLTIENQNREDRVGRHFSNVVSPDASASLDVRAARWVSVHLTSSYGTTFVYLDNIPRKFEIAYGVRLAPFTWVQASGVLRATRVEAAGLAFYFHDADEWLALPLPIFPYIYWQFHPRLGGRSPEAAPGGP